MFCALSLCAILFSSVCLQCYCQFALCWRTPTQTTLWCLTLHASTRPMWPSSTRMQRTGQQNMPCNVERGSQRRAALGGDWERSASTLAQKLGQHMDSHVFVWFLILPSHSWCGHGSWGPLVAKEGDKKWDSGDLCVDYVLGEWWSNVCQTVFARDDCRHLISCCTGSSVKSSNGQHQ